MEKLSKYSWRQKLPLKRGDHESCVIGCRKAVFLAVERNYDISEYKDGEPKGLFGGYTRAPFYVRNKEYIDKNVHDPTDFIVRDHSRLDQELLTQGVDNTAFWNVWRLTPEVYRTEGGEWIVKRDFGKLDPRFLSDNVDYIFSTTVDILVAIHTTSKATRMAKKGRYYLELANENVPVYEKADMKSKVFATTPPGMTRIDTDFQILGLEGDGPYWHVSHFEKEIILFGYIHNDHVKVNG